MEGVRRKYDIPGDFIFIGESTVYGDAAWRIKGHGHMNRGCIVQVKADITFGAYVRVAPYCTFWTATPEFNQNMRRHEHHIVRKCLPIVIGDGVYIGSHCTIAPGVVIGDNAWIAPNTLVAGRVPAGALVAGVPGKIVRFKSGYGR